MLVLCMEPIEAQPEAPAPGVVLLQNGIDVDQLITQFIANAEEYERTFRNLTATETKTIEVYKDSGAVEKRRQIVSDLVVYRASRNGADAVTEYRDVQSVDGRAIARRGERAVKLLTDARKASSLDKELETIDRETSRYEFNRHLRGVTLRPGGVLKERRTAFQVQQVGRDQVAGHDVVVLDYRQAAPIPGFLLPVPKEFGKPSPVHRGRLWLDAQTGQVWRHRWELAWPHPATPELLVMLRQESTYRASPFGILVPERIMWDWLTRFEHPKRKPPTFLLSERTTFTYDSFKRFEVVTSEKVDVPNARDR